MLIVSLLLMLSNGEVMMEWWFPLMQALTGAAYDGSEAFEWVGRVAYLNTSTDRAILRHP